MEEINKYNKVNLSTVDAVLFNRINVSVDAALKIIENKVGAYDSVFKVIKERVEADISKMKAEITNTINEYIEKANSARALVAGIGCDDKAEFKNGFLDCGQSFPVSEGFLRSFGIRRIADKKAFEICLNGNIVEGTALTEEDANRVYNAIENAYEAWKSEKTNANKG